MGKTRGKEIRECANPNCKNLFEAYSSRHKVCENPFCKEWLRSQHFSKTKYKFTKKFIDSVTMFDTVDCLLNNLTFTNNDIEKVEE